MKPLLLPFLAFAALQVCAQAPAVQWVDEFTCSDGAGVYSGESARVHAMANGDVLQLSWLRGTWDLDPGPEEDLHTGQPYPSTLTAVARYDPQGALLWSWTLGTASGYTVPMQGAELPGGDFLLIGTTGNGLDMDPGPGEAWRYPTPGTNNIWLARYTAQGSFVWGRVYTSPGGAFAYRVAPDASGAIWICGIFNTTLDLGDGVVLQGVGATDGFMAKLDPQGNALWGHAVASALNDNYIDLALSADGQYVYLAGNYSGTVDFAPGPGTTTLTESTGSIDGFISCMDTSGALVWAHTLGGTTGYAFPNELEAVADGFIVVGGFTGSAQVDPLDTTFQVTPIGFWAGLSVARYNTAGGLVWFDNLATNGGGSGSRTTCTSTGDPVVTWTIGGNVDLDPGPDTLQVGVFGNTEAVIVNYHGSDGSYAWHHMVQGPGAENLTDVTSLRNHAFWVCGQHTGTGSTVDTVALAATECTNGMLIKFLRCDSAIISAEGAVLTASPGDAFQWYLGGAAIPGATDSVYEAVVDGDYSVTVSDVAGCVRTSAPYALNTNAIAKEEGPQLLWREGILYLPQATGNARVRVFATGGAVLHDRSHASGTFVDLRFLPASLYLISASDGNGDARLRVFWRGER